MAQDCQLSLFLIADRNLQTLQTKKKKKTQHKKLEAKNNSKCIFLKPVIDKIKLTNWKA